MPMKRRRPKRRSDLGKEIAAWTDVFLFGFDFSGELEKVGVPISQGYPDLAALEEAWRRLGEQFLTNCKGVGDPEIWAVRELGAPHAS